jgi:phosphatidylglycerophosphate synthase
MMSTPLPAPPSPPLIESGLASLGLGAFAAAAPWLGGFGLGAAGVAGALFAAVAILVALGLQRYRLDRFGTANAVTMVRAAAVSALAGIAVAAPAVEPAAGLASCGLALLALDGFDGWVARRHGTASPFGARFDMETDALLMLVLAVLVWRIGHAGAWVLAAGLLRYGFVLAGRAWPALARPLPPSERRRRICGVAIALLSVAAAPLPPAAVSLLCAIAVGSLIYSFAVDSIWLVRYAPALPVAACRS